ncbi:hypothetical protein BD626DRAFT_520497 [Schizophyllum amplum]|uniref:Uncharacterized protein n=1 Tax=Schizophyllum amplum TaxID=97359 RepID=A0A550BUF1_9AGAR|nr:hypothetical protein BD626DRAFT_520497 [Auriculariopsis ampla]
MLRVLDLGVTAHRIITNITAPRLDEVALRITVRTDPFPALLAFIVRSGQIRKLTLDKIDLESTATFLSCMERMDGLREFHLEEHALSLWLLKEDGLARMTCLDMHTPTGPPLTDGPASGDRAVEQGHALSRPLLPSLTAIRLRLVKRGELWRDSLKKMLLSRRQARVYGTWTVPALKDVEVKIAGC